MVAIQTLVLCISETTTNQHTNYISYFRETSSKIFLKLTEALLSLTSVKPKGV